jgi:casein kinase I family protein HRR25
LPGTVFVGSHTIAGKSVAIKLEPCIDNSKSNVPEKPPYHPSPLLTESRIYKSLSGGPGVPYILWSGKSGDYNVLVVDLLGPSLEDLFKACNKCFSLHTVLLLADQLVSLVPLRRVSLSSSFHLSYLAFNISTRAISSIVT